VNQKVIKNPVVITTTLTVLISVIWLLYGRITPISCSGLGIYVDEPTLLTITMFFTLIAANFLNSVVPRLTYTHILLNIMICFFAPQGIFRIYDQNKMPVILFLSFAVTMGIIITIFRKRNKCKKVHLLFYMRHIVAVGLITIILPSQLYLDFSMGSEYYCYVETTPVMNGKSADFNEFKNEIQSINWGRLNLEEKSNIVAKLITIEGTELGLKELPSIRIEDFENTRVNAFYENNKIHLNSFYFSKSKSEVVATATHELYHAYQKELIDKTKNILSKETLELQYFSELSAWMSADERYIADKDHYDTYYNNALEKAARDYSDKLLEKYELKDAD